MNAEKGSNPEPFVAPEIISGDTGTNDGHSDCADLSVSLRMPLDREALRTRRVATAMLVLGAMLESASAAPVPPDPAPPAE